MNKLKKQLIKEFQLLRLREPNMRKKEYYQRLQRLQESDLSQALEQSIKKTKGDGRKESPEEILRKLLLDQT